MTPRSIFLTAAGAVLLSLAVIFLAVFFSGSGRGDEAAAPSLGTRARIPDGEPKEAARSVTAGGIRVADAPSSEERSGAVIPPPATVPDLLRKGIEFVKKALPKVVSEAETKEENKGGLSQSATTTVLTEAEVFNIIWPKEFIQSLRDIENMVIIAGGENSEGVIAIAGLSTSTLKAAPGGEEDTVFVKKWLIPESERTKSFSSDEDVYQSLLTILKETYKQGWVGDQEYNNLFHGITKVLPEIIEKEKEAIRFRGLRSSIIPLRQGSLADRGIRQIAQELFAEVLYAILNAKPALAGWYISPDCYKDDDPNKQELGFNAWAPCCNCGIACDDEGCWFMENCGLGGFACEVQLGCLNGACEDWPNAIWDPDTGICGCG